METTRGFRLWGLVQMRTFGLGVSSQWAVRVSSVLWAQCWVTVGLEGLGLG